MAESWDSLMQEEKERKQAAALEKEQKEKREREIQRMVLTPDDENCLWLGEEIELHQKFGWQKAGSKYVSDGTGGVEYKSGYDVTQKSDGSYEVKDHYETTTSSIKRQIHLYRDTAKIKNLEALTEYENEAWQVYRQYQTLQKNPHKMLSFLSLVFTPIVWILNCIKHLFIDEPTAIMLSMLIVAAIGLLIAAYINIAFLPVFFIYALVTYKEKNKYYKPYQEKLKEIVEKAHQECEF